MIDRTALAAPGTPEEQQLRDSFEKDQERMIELIDELGKLGIELKDFRTGLIDFPCWKDDCSTKTIPPPVRIAS